MRQRVLPWLLVSVTGCWDARRAECDLLVKTTSPEIEAIAGDALGLPEEPKSAAEALGGIAARYDGLARRLGGIGFGTPELQAHAIAYQRIAADAADATRRLATAIAADDPQRQQQAEQAYGAVTGRQKQLIGEVNAFCRQ